MVAGKHTQTHRHIPAWNTRRPAPLALPVVPASINRGCNHGMVQMNLVSAPQPMLSGPRSPLQLNPGGIVHLQVLCFSLSSIKLVPVKPAPKTPCKCSVSFEVDRWLSCSARCPSRKAASDSPSIKPRGKKKRHAHARE